MPEPDQLRRLRTKLRLAAITDHRREVFGAGTHDYVLDPPATEPELAAFEQANGITLPESYRSFLLEVGNGGPTRPGTMAGSCGAGPFYGIYRLDADNNEMIDGLSAAQLRQPPFFTSVTTEAAWEEFAATLDELPSAEYERRTAEAYAGILVIGYCGCSGFTGIMTGGPDRGRVLFLSQEPEFCPQFVTEPNFLSWYEAWLDGILSGRQIIHSVLAVESGAALLQAYLRAPGERRCYYLSCLRSLNEVSPEMLKAIRHALHRETDHARTLCLHLLARFDYDNTRAELLALAQSDPLEFLKILYWYHRPKLTEWSDVIGRLAEQGPEDARFYIQHLVRPYWD